jgi:hypothetical protein
MLKHSDKMYFNDAVSGIAILIFSLVIFTLTRNYPTLDNKFYGPALFPRLIAVIMFFLSLTLIIKGGKKLKTKKEKVFMTDISGEGYLNLCTLLLGIIAYIFLAEYVTFPIIAFIYLFLSMFRLKVRPLFSALISVIVVTIVYFLFIRILRVPLPMYFGF